jgi:hypothetical protein
VLSLAERSVVSKATGLARIAFLIAAIGSLAVAVLLLAAYFGIWMGGANLHPTPRINALTVGLAFVPIPVFFWITYVWARTRPSRFLDISFRMAISCVLVIGAGYCVFAAMFLAFFVG